MPQFTTTPTGGITMSVPTRVTVRDRYVALVPDMSGLTGLDARPVWDVLIPLFSRLHPSSQGAYRRALSDSNVKDAMMAFQFTVTDRDVTRLEQYIEDVVWSR